MRTWLLGVGLSLAVGGVATAAGTAASAATASGTLTCGVGYVCTIELPAGSALQGDPFMFGGCRTGSTRTTGCLWQLEWSVAGAKTPIVALTPNYDGLKTNILIATDRGIFNVDLRSDARAGRSSVAFADASPLVPGGAALDLLPTPTPAATVDDVLRAAQVANPDPRWETWYPDYCATLTGHPDFKPVFVVSDGARTIMAMPYWMHATPSVFALVGNDHVQVQASKQGRMWIFDGAPDEFELVVADQRVLEKKGSRC